MSDNETPPPNYDCGAAARLKRALVQGLPEYFSPRDVAWALERIAELEGALSSIAADVSSGLCCFTREGMRAALIDIQKQTNALGYDVLGEEKPDHEQ